MKFIISILLLGFFVIQTTKFSGKKNISKSEKIISHTIKSDSTEYILNQVVDSVGFTQYYFRNIEEFPCKSNGECRLMQIKMYWDAFGNYLKYELPQNEDLTKLDHKEFSSKEYINLHNILLDTTSDFRYLKLQDLTEHQAENSFYGMDAVSGATITNRDFECINGAVKTTYKLWHLANDQTSEYIKQLNLNKNQLQLSNMGNEPISLRTDQINQLIYGNRYLFSKYLNNLEPVTNNTRKDIRNSAENILVNNNWNALLMYNFLMRNELKKTNKFTRKYSKTFLLKHIKPEERLKKQENYKKFNPSFYQVNIN